MRNMIGKGGVARVSAFLVACGMVLANMTTSASALTAYEASFEPGPSGDAFLDQDFAPAASVANGTVLDSRPVTITGPLATTSSFTAWQTWFKTTDADNKPIASVTTILKPTTWNGKVVSNNYAIDGLGLQCNMSYQMTHEFTVEAPDITRQLLWGGYAVVLTDYQGPHMAYSNGPTQGPEVLDGIRAALNFAPAALQNEATTTPVAMVGYSGGAIATVWAAQMHPTYAPEINLVGAASGGTPADLSLMRNTMDGRPPAGALYMMAALGNARVTPGALNLLNPIGVAAARQFKDACFSTAALAGIAPIPLAVMTNPFIYQNQITKNIYAKTKAGGMKPTAPIFMWHGVDDQWIPLAGAVTLKNTWKAQGADVTLSVVPGEHMIAAYDAGALNAINQWMGQ